MRPVILLLVLCWCGLARADDGATVGLSGAVEIMDAHPTIRMVSEVVRIKLPEGKVHAEFVFRNEGPAITVRMAFPESGGGDVVTPKKVQDYLDGFRSYVDGIPVNVTRVVDKENTGEQNYSVWWVKKVPFARGQTRTVVNEYRSDGSSEVGGLRGWGYVLTTGASWKGPIGDALITADVGGLDVCSDVKISPNGFKRNGNIVTWHFQNIEPKEDIGFGWFDGFMDIVVNGHPINEQHGPRGVSIRRDWDYSWGFPYARREGHEVFAPVAGIAAWLGAKVEALKTFEPPQGRHRKGAQVVRLSRGSRWVEPTNGSKTMRTSSRVVTLFHAPQFEPRSTDIFAELTPIVRALGGTARFDDKTKRMIVWIK